MRLVALSVGLPEYYFEENLTRDPVIIQRVIHYPAITSFGSDGLRISAGKHTDYGLVTLLYQNEWGLQMREDNKISNESTWVWVCPPPVPYAFTVNIGDCLQILTNGCYPSTVHRVVNCSGHDRYSMAFFLDPDFDALIEPIDALSNLRGEDKKFKPIKAGHVKLAKYQAVWKDENLGIAGNEDLEESTKRALWK